MDGLVGGITASLTRIVSEEVCPESPANRTYRRDYGIDEIDLQRTSAKLLLSPDPL